MARPRRIDRDSILQASLVVGRTTDVTELRQALSILLPAYCGCTLEETAKVLGVGRATVPRLQAAFRLAARDTGTPKRRAASWGGRRRALMSEQEEGEFLEPWARLAKEGRVLVLSPIRAALAQRLGRPVPASVVYRLLERHGWRKLAPDTRHPKSDPTVQEAWKKNSRRIWLPS
jgi:transposase